MPKIFHALDKIKPVYDVTEKIMMFICKLLLIADILVTCYIVIGRYISFIDPPVWGEQVVLTLMVYMAVLSATIAIRNNGCKLIAVTGNPDSWLGKYCEVCLKAGVDREGGVLNRAPRASILAEIFVLQCLSVVLQEHADLTPESYIRRHPGGKLGELRENEK